MRPLISVAIMLTIFSCVDYQAIDKGSVRSAAVPPLSIFHLQAALVGKTYVVVGQTRSIPPTPIKKFKAHVYEITISMKVNGVDNWWSTPFEVALILPNGEIEYHLLNKEQFTLSSAFIEDFRIIVETPIKGRVKCALSRVNRYQKQFSLADYDWWYVDLN